jgi:hypothetical protein
MFLVILARGARGGESRSTMAGGAQSGAVMAETVNEITFVSRLGVATRLRAEKREHQGLPVHIFSGELEERQVDSAGHIKRCDIRLNSRTGQKLASGEVKRPEVADGRDPRNETLREDARQKAVARGLTFYFTCNMREVVLYSVGLRTGQPDREEYSKVLSEISHSSAVDAHRAEIETNWSEFLDDLDERLGEDDARPLRQRHRGGGWRGGRRQRGSLCGADERRRARPRHDRHPLQKS